MSPSLELGPTSFPPLPPATASRETLTIATSHHKATCNHKVTKSHTHIHTHTCRLLSCKVVFLVTECSYRQQYQPTNHCDITRPPAYHSIASENPPPRVSIFSFRSQCVLYDYFREESYRLVSVMMLRLCCVIWWLLLSHRKLKETVASPKRTTAARPTAKEPLQTTKGNRPAAVRRLTDYRDKLVNSCFFEMVKLNVPQHGYISIV